MSKFYYWALSLTHGVLTTDPVEASRWVTKLQLAGEPMTSGIADSWLERQAAIDAFYLKEGV